MHGQSPRLWIDLPSKRLARSLLKQKSDQNKCMSVQEYRTVLGELYRCLTWSRTLTEWIPLY